MVVGILLGLLALSRVEGLLLQDRGASAAELIQGLGSSTLEERAAAERKLRDLGEAARAELEKAAKLPDIEMSRRAAVLLRLLDLRGKVSPLLREKLPNLEDRLANGADHEWTLAFLEAGRLALPGDDLAFLLGPALRGARSVVEKTTACEVVRSRRIRQAIPDLLRLLGDADPGLARTVSRSLRELDGPELRRSLLALLPAGPVPARLAACELLDDLRVREALPAIAALLEDPNAGLRKQAVVALVHFEAKERAPAIAALLKDSDAAARDEAVRALRRLGARDAARSAVGLLTHEREGVRQSAARALGFLKLREAAPELAKACADPDPETRAAAVWALAELGDAAPLPLLLELAGDKDALVRAPALWALGRRKNKEAAPAVLRALQDADVGVKRLAAWAAGALELGEAGPALIGLMGDVREDVRRVAAGAAGRLGRKEAVPALLRILGSDSTPVQEEAAWALGRIRAPEAIPALLAPAELRRRKVLEKQLRAGAFDALRGLAAEDVLPPARALLDGKDLALRRIGAEALRAARSPASAPRLLQLLADPDETIQAIAARALGEQGVKEAIPRLLEILGDDSSDALAAAATALSLLGAAEALPTLRRLVKDLSSSDEFEVVRALERFGDEASRDFVIAGLSEFRDDGVLAAGMWLCREGRKVAIQPLLDYGEVYVPLNALRRPEDWEKLCRARVEGDLEGSLLEIAERIAAAAGLEAELETEDPEPDLEILLRRFRIPNLDGRLTAAEALLELIRRTEEDYEAVLEAGRLRIVPWDYAEEFWDRWGAEALRSK